MASSTVCGLLFALIVAANCFEIYEKGGPIHKRLGESTRLECSFHGDDFNWQDAHVNWKKKQDDNDAVTVSTNKRTEGVFNSDSRLSVSDELPSGLSDGYARALVISDLKPEDTGDYICTVGLHGGQEKTITHNLKIFDPVDAISLVGSATQNLPENATDTPTLVFKEGSLAHVRCSTEGGYPAPTIKVYKEDVEGNRKQITGFRDVPGSPQMMLEGDILGMKTYTTKRTESNTQVRMEKQYDQGKIICRADVDQTAANPATAVEIERVITVNALPYFHTNSCDTTHYARSGENVTIRCQFYSTPQAKEVTWDTQATEDVKLVGDNLYETTHSIINAKSSDFRVYELVVANDVGTSRRMITLREGTDPEESTSDNTSDAPVLRASGLLALISLASIATLLGNRVV